MSPRQRFPIASVTKTLTALTAARLCAEGVVDWNAPTGFRATDGEPISLRNLLRHAARVPSELHPRHWHVGQSLTVGDIDGLAGRVPTVDLPPLTWHYSNLGYALVARALQDASGEHFPSLLGRVILKPLGMSETSFYDANQSSRPAATMLAAESAGGLWSTLEGSGDPG